MDSQSPIPGYIFPSKEVPLHYLPQTMPHTGEKVVKCKIPKGTFSLKQPQMTSRVLNEEEEMEEPESLGDKGQASTVDVDPDMWREQAK